MKSEGNAPVAGHLPYDATVDSQRPEVVPESGRMLLHHGYLLENRYVIGRPIGEGAMGAVYEARHVLLNRKVAVKVVETSHQTASSPLREDVLREGQNLATIGHPHVVEIFDLGFVNSLCYIVMAYLDGETLEQRLSRTGPLDFPTAWLLARQVLSGLAAAHAKGIVHRDLKPGNIFLARAGDETLHSKLLDFGISTTLAAAATSRVAGTPAYMAPEQMNGEPVDHRADLYGLGATLYEVLTGKRPFSARTINSLYYKVCFEPPVPPSQHRGDIPRELEAIVLKALEKQREDRFASAQEMMEAIDAAARSASSAQSVRPQREYILIAEPNPEAAARCRAAAEDLGRAAVIARDGAEALEMAQSLGPPALVIANLSLPRVDGFSLLKQLRARLDVAVPAVVASPFPSLREAAAARKEALGVVAVLNDFGSSEALRAAAAPVFNIAEAGAGEAAGLTETANERQRLARIAAMGLVDDRPPPEALQHLVGEVAAALDVPIALVSLVLEDRQWFKAHIGIGGEVLAARGTPRAWAFCHHVVEGREPLVVPDAVNHPVFSTNPLVEDGTVGGYIGAPVVSASGDVLGTLCVIDNKPLQYGQDAVDALCALARRVGGELELSVRAPPPAPAAPGPRRDALPDLPSLAEPGSELDLGTAMRDPKLGVVVLDESRKVIDVNAGFCKLLNVPRERVVGFPRDEMLHAISTRFQDPAFFLRRTAVLPRGPFAAFDRFNAAGSSGRHISWHAKPLRTPQGIWHLESFHAES